MPSLSATIALSSATITVGQVLNAVLTVSNSSGAAISINQILPRINFTGNSVPLDGSSVSYGAVPLSQGFNSSVAASGSADFLISYSIYSPSIKQDDSGTGTYDVSAQVIGNNGEQIAPTAATVTVHPVLPVF